MPDDNPYAAPQTSLSQAASLKLPLAEPAGRQLYPELDTAALLVLARRSNAIQAAWTVWIMLLGALSLLALPAYRLQLLEPWQLAILISAYPIGGLRVYLCRQGRLRQRMVLIAADFWLLAIFLFLTFLFGSKFLEEPRGLSGALLGTIIFSLLCAIPCISLNALLRAARLFGPESFVISELAEEAAYRQRYGIL
jgi:hypothetical protein